MYYTNTMLKVSYRSLFKRRPEIQAAYNSLSEADRANIDRQVVNITSQIKMIGPAGALELLFQLGRFLNKKAVLA